MTDYSELERLAEEAIRQCDDCGKFAVALRNMQRHAGPTEVLAMIAENKRLATQVRLAGLSAEMAVHDTVGRAAAEYLVVEQERDQLKAELESVQPYFEDVERLCKVLGYLGISTPEGGEEQAARWLSLVRTMIRAAETSKLLRHDAEKIAENERLKAENEGFKTGYEAYEQVNAELKGAVEALRKDKDRLDAIESNFWDVRYSSSQNGDAGDGNVSIEIVGCWMDKPTERVIGENYSENLRAAIDQAMKAPAYPPARPEYEFDECPDFGGGGGNRARRRAESMGIDYDAAMSKEGRR